MEYYTAIYRSKSTDPYDKEDSQKHFAPTNACSV